MRQSIKKQKFRPGIYKDMNSPKKIVTFTSVLPIIVWGDTADPVLWSIVARLKRSHSIHLYGEMFGLCGSKRIGPRHSFPVT